MELIDELKMEVKRRNIQDPKEVQAVISEKLVEIYQAGEEDTPRIKYSRRWLDRHFICRSEWGRKNNNNW